jgi:hypothetical protein
MLKRLIVAAALASALGSSLVACTDKAGSAQNFLPATQQQQQRRAQDSGGGLPGG